MDNSERIKEIEAYCKWCEDHHFIWAWSAKTEDIRFLLEEAKKANNVQQTKSPETV